MSDATAKTEAAARSSEQDSVVDDRPASEHFLDLRGVTKAFYGRTVLKQVDFTLDAGEIAVLIGKSGSGKSTLLRIIAGLAQADGGDIDMMGERVVIAGDYQPSWKEHRNQIGMIFQSYTLWPHLNVRENLGLAPKKVLGESAKEIRERAQIALADVGMEHHIDSRCGQLSGGERQRVAIARALMMRPRLLLCDEMTSALDPPVAAEVLGVITKLKEEEGIGCILVTHDMAFAAKAADRVAYFEEGVIAEEGDPQKLLQDPETEGLKRFVDAVRF